MPYSNEYDAIPICRTHARMEPVWTPQILTRACVRQFCRLSHALSLPVRSHSKKSLCTGYLLSIISVSFLSDMYLLKSLGIWFIFILFFASQVVYYRCFLSLIPKIGTVKGKIHVLMAKRKVRNIVHLRSQSQSLLLSISHRVNNQLTNAPNKRMRRLQ